MSTNPNAVTGLPLSGGTLTGSLTLSGGALFANGGDITIGSGQGTNTSASANVITPANVNGTAAQLADTGRDYMVYLTVGTAGTALTVAIGPTAGVANTVYNAATATAGETIAFRLPTGWFWKWTATTATLASQLAIAC